MKTPKTLLPFWWQIIGVYLAFAGISYWATWLALS
jgi:hypothetical protein